MLNPLIYNMLCFALSHYENTAPKVTGFSYYMGGNSYLEISAVLASVRLSDGGAAVTSRLGPAPRMLASARPPGVGGMRPKLAEASSKGDRSSVGMTSDLSRHDLFFLTADRDGSRKEA